MARLDPEQALSATRLLGETRRALRVGPWRIVFEGLDAATALTLDHRWGDFAAPAGSLDADASVRLLAAGPGSFLEAEPGEIYRLEARGAGIVSYHLAACRDRGESWRAAIAASDDEPREQILDNLSRLLVARLALRAGGFPLHGAGIVLGDRAFVFAGPSRAGKSTAARRAAPARSLGDDFAVIVPRAAGFAAIAVPFDNLGNAPAGAPRDPIPLAGVFRLVKSTEEPRIVRLAGPLAAASLLGCAAFPWAVPDLAERLLAPADRIVHAGLFGELRFGLTTDVAAVIGAAWSEPG